jgi:hypothetical protein
MNSRVRMSIVAATLVAAAAAESALTGAAAIAAPPSSGCPRGFQVLSVQTLTAAGYKVPALIDDPASGVVGQEGQGNGKAWIGRRRAVPMQSMWRPCGDGC